MSASTTTVQLRSAADTVAQDWPRLRDYLAGHGLTLEIEPAPRQFAGGFANLNYLVMIDDHEAVLRRPPMGPLPPGADDLALDARILTDIGPSFPLAPRATHLRCEQRRRGTGGVRTCKSLWAPVVVKKKT